MMQSSSSICGVSPTNHHNQNQNHSNDDGGGGEDSGDRRDVSALEMNEIDLDNLRQVFGTASSEDLNCRKPHELRELWIEKTAEVNTMDAMTTTTTTTTTPSPKARMPRFLLDPSEEDHVPPHVVALQLLMGRRRSSRISDGDGLYKPVAFSSDDNEKGGGGGDNDAPSSRHHNSTHTPRRNTKNKNSNAANTLQGTVMVWPLILVALVMVACQFVLEVLGGAGAIWGTAELFTLRTGGSGHPSWRLFTIWASVVGTCCLLRFLLVHPFFPGANDPTFVEKHNLRDLLRRYKGGTHRVGVFFELVTLVARDPVLFLHPAKGPVQSWWCSCYCICCGNRLSLCNMDSDSGSDDDAESGNHYGSCSRSPISSGSLEKPSANRSTWDLSDDDEEATGECGTAAGP